MTKKLNEIERMVDLTERLGVMGLYMFTDMSYHDIARKMGMGTQRVMSLLKGIKKLKSHG